MRLLGGADQHCEMIGERNWNRQAGWMEEASEEGQGPPEAVEPVVMVVVVVVMTTTVMMYLHSTYVPSRYGNGLQCFIFTLHGIEPHDTSTIKLQVSHCTD